MKFKTIMILTIIALCCFILSAKADVTLFRYNQSRTGESPYIGPTSPVLKWTYDTGAYNTSTPAIDSSGNLYLGDFSGYLLSISADGKLNWSYKTNDLIVTSPAIDSDGTIYFGGLDSIFYAINSDGSLKWSYKTEGSIYSSPNVTTNAIYFGSDDHNLYSLDKSGKLQWKFLTDSWVSSSPSLDSEGIIYFGSYDGKIYALNQDGLIDWTYDTGTYIYSSPAVNSDKQVFFGGYDGKMYAIKDGSLSWTYQTGSIIYSSPAISSISGNVYFGSNDTSVYALNPDGELLWSYSVDINPLGLQNFSSSPVIDREGNIYIGSQSKYIYSFDPLGTLRWSYGASLPSVIASPVIATDNLLYYASTDHMIYALTDKSSGAYLFDPSGRKEPGTLEPIVPNVPDGHYRAMLEKGIYTANPNEINDPMLSTIYKERVARSGILNGAIDHKYSDRYAFEGSLPQPTALDEAMKLLHLDAKNFKQDIYFMSTTPYILDITNVVMDNPLKVLDYAHEQVGLIYDPATTIFDLIKDAANLIDLNVQDVYFEHEISNDYPLADAINDICKDFGQPLTTDQIDELKVSTDSLPLLLNKVTAFLLYACQEAAIKRDIALSGLQTSERTYLNDNVTKPEGDTIEAALQVLQLCERIDRAKLSEAAMTIASAMNNISSVMITESLAFQKKANKYKAVDNPDVTGDVLFYYSTPLGSIIIGGPGKTIYNSTLDSTTDKTKVPFLIIDLGGDDEYYNRAGATFDLKNPVSLLLDLSGNDIYNSGNDFSQGAAKLGVGILIDYSGNDKYTATNFAQGSGYIGTGVICDFQGNDVYKSIFDVQASAAIGIGILEDDKGDDEYYGGTACQGFGFTQGAAIFKEVEGNDSYYACGGQNAPYDQDPGYERYTTQGQGAAFGVRNLYIDEPHAAGGFAIMSDNYGNDTYIGDFYAQGNAYWLDTAMLVDCHGDDFYYSRHYTQGVGVHLAVGLLLDESGNDTYIALAVTQGMGLDTSAGFLVDNAGDDFYFAEHIGQGGSSGWSLGILADGSGNDQYFGLSSQGMQGSGNFREVMNSIGLILDAGGNDYYTDYYYDDNRHWAKGSLGFGIGIDSEIGDTGVH
jgi:outer membrane protein assembly factor BamB